MNKKIIKVPFGIQYMSEWKDYQYPTGHCIVDKGVTGCGYTEYCLRNDRNIILCSPRKLLLENKYEQHLEDKNLFYFRNEIKDVSDVVSVNQKFAEHIINCQILNKPIKFLVTYDSVRYILDYLESNGTLDQFNIVADEMQSIFLDSYFKAAVENDFVSTIQRCPNVIYLSATPMLDKYLEKVDQFKDLQFYTIDWSDTGYIEYLQIERKHVSSLNSELNKVVQDFLSEKYPVFVTDDGNIIKSKEAVFYINSVTDIVKVINKNKLSVDQVNILCSDTDENRRRLKRIKHSIGKIPLKDEPRKMFTFCTSTVYIGADFYSPCASTYIFANPNLRNLAMDISLDLPQIAGRQRNKENPFKNHISIFYKTLRKENLEDRAMFDEIQKQRKEKTEALLSLFDRAQNDRERSAMVDNIRVCIEAINYENDFVSISRSTGKPAYNKFIELANERAWEVSQKDYQDTISVTKVISSLDVVESVSEYKDRDDKIIDDFLSNKFFKTGIFSAKMKLYCEFMDKYGDNKYISDILKFKIPDMRYKNYYTFFGSSRCGTLKYEESLLSNAMLKESSAAVDIHNQVYNIFNEGAKYTSKELKQKLSDLYSSLDINTKTPKASDIEKWFEVKRIQIFNPITKKRDHGYELISIKKRQ